MKNVPHNVLNKLSIDDKKTKLSSKDVVVFTEIKHGKMCIFLHRLSKNKNKRVWVLLAKDRNLGSKGYVLRESLELMEIISELTNLDFKELKIQMTSHVYIMTSSTIQTLESSKA